MDKRAFLAVVLLLGGTLVTAYKRNKPCLPSDKVCTFHLEAKFGLTMMKGRSIKVFAEDGKLYEYNVKNTSNADPVPTDEVHSADGWEESRLITVANDQFPGPDIIVYKGQTVVVNVKNEIEGEDLTIHWHGLDQAGTPWMDGVPYISHCPVLPYQSFRYEFKANEKGTFWWHSHAGTQRTNGLYGAFIVRTKTEPYPNEHIMIIQDWNHDEDSNLNTLKSGYYDGRERWTRFQTMDGHTYGPYRIHSALINGKGRYRNFQTNQVIEAPLTTYEVESGEVYRFRVITAAAFYPFRVSVDNHTMKVISSDGHDLKPYECESFIIFPGERYDFIITADQAIGNYWVRATALVKENAPLAEAILRYEGASEENPETVQSCTLTSKCIVLNCPFMYYPENFTECRTYNVLNSKTKTRPAPEYEQNNFRQYFLNFGFPGGTASVNGKQFVSPDVNILTQPKEFSSLCSEADCGPDKACRCMHTLKFPGNKIIQLVMTNLVNGGFSEPHPIHVHGHTFRLIKTGYGRYDPVDGRYLGPTTDIDCGRPDQNNQILCNDGQWADKSWNRDLPDANIERAPFKDTVVVPGGGYAVIRFIADNPGIWNVHCHMEPHNAAGMRFILNESFPEIPQAPVSLPKCRSYPVSEYRERELEKCECAK